MNDTSTTKERRVHPETHEEYTAAMLDESIQAMLFPDGMLILKQGRMTMLLSDVAAMHLANLLLAHSQAKKSEGSHDH